MAAGLFHLYAGFFGLFSSTVQRGVHWLFMLVLVLLLHPAGRGQRSWRLDGILLAGACLSSFYLLWTWPERVLRVQPPTGTEVVLGTVMILLTLEAARRTAGWFLVLTCVLFLLYANLGASLPGILGHPGHSLSRIVSNLYTSMEGIYGTPIGVSATYIVLFVLFGTFLNAAGGGEFFLNLSRAMARFRAGPAKTAVLSSALMGTISGSPVANAVTTGTFTVPMMVRMGYPPHWAAAVEAAASTGSMVMPPIMGSAAFIMADFLQVEYRQIALAALFPALLYFLAIFLIVDFKARAAGQTAGAEKVGPGFFATLKEGWHILVSLAGLLGFLLAGWSAIQSVLQAMVLVWVLTPFQRRYRWSLRGWAGAMVEGVQASAQVAAACAAAGIILGVINMTGLGLTFSSALLELSGGYHLPALLVTMAACVILGMGLPAAAVYVLVAALAAPPLVEMGFSLLAAHMFVFYFGIMSTITPPVALTAYAAAAIAGTEPMKVGWVAARLGLIGYVIPFMFIYSPSLLLQGDSDRVLLAVPTAAAGILALSLALEGYFLRRLQLLERGIGFAAGLLLVKPGLTTDLPGIVLLAGLLGWVATTSRRKGRQSPPGEVEFGKGK